MIRPDEVISIGHITRTHGVKGEVVMTITSDVFDRTECPCLVLSMDGILVPFFIDEYRFKSDTTVLISFERIDTVEKARIFMGKEVFFLRQWLPEEEEETYTWQTFVGYTAEDLSQGTIGVVEDVDDSTINILFVVKRFNGQECLIPAQEAFIEHIDHTKRHIIFNLPEGLID